MVRILIIQFRNNDRAQALEQESITRELSSMVEIDCVSALDESVLWNAPEALLAPYGGVILGGSGDFDFHGNRSSSDSKRMISYQLLEKLRPLLQYIFDTNIPTLGICYGHQLLGMFRGVAVTCDPVQKKTRSHEVCITNAVCDCVLLKDVPKNFKTHYGHNDVLVAVPKGATLLAAGGEMCKVSALQYTNHIFSTQFHPELNLNDLNVRMKTILRYLPEGMSVEDLFEEAPEAHKILHNFGSLVVAQAKNEGGPK